VGLDTGRPCAMTTSVGWVTKMYVASYLRDDGTWCILRAPNCCPTVMIVQNGLAPLRTCHKWTEVVRSNYSLTIPTC
jgi:hypothetical protein